MERAIAAIVIVLLTLINLAGVKWVIRLQFVLLVVLLLGAADFVMGSFSHKDEGTVLPKNEKKNLARPCD